MLFLHPVIISVSFAVSLIWCVKLNGKKVWGFILKFILPVMLAVALFNPLFNHRGVTVLFYLGDNPITLEAVLYGIVSALMFGGVLLWFSCFGVLMTSDKLLYIFGKAAPSVSLVAVMVLRFVPLFKTQLRRAALNEKCMGGGAAAGNFIDRAKNGLNILSSMLTWALENAIITSDSMRARGLGLQKRAFFSPYRFGARDKICGLVMFIGIVSTGISAGLKSVSIRFFPSFRMNAFNFAAAAFYLTYALTVSLPLILDLREACVWRSLKSKI